MTELGDFGKLGLNVLAEILSWLDYPNLAKFIGLNKHIIDLFNKNKKLKFNEKIDKHNDLTKSLYKIIFSGVEILTIEYEYRKYPNYTRNIYTGNREYWSINMTNISAAIEINGVNLSMYLFNDFIDYKMEYSIEHGGDDNIDEFLMEFKKMFSPKDRINMLNSIKILKLIKTEGDASLVNYMFSMLKHINLNIFDEHKNHPEFGDFNQIPENIIIEIIQYLDFKSMVNFMCINKTMYQLRIEEFNDIMKYMIGNYCLVKTWIDLRETFNSSINEFEYVNTLYLGHSLKIISKYNMDVDDMTYIISNDVFNVEFELKKKLFDTEETCELFRRIGDMSSLGDKNLINIFQVFQMDDYVLNSEESPEILQEIYNIINNYITFYRFFMTNLGSRVFRKNEYEEIEDDEIEDEYVSEDEDEDEDEDEYENFNIEDLIKMK